MKAISRRSHQYLSSTSARWIPNLIMRTTWKICSEARITLSRKLLMTSYRMISKIIPGLSRKDVRSKRAFKKKCTKVIRIGLVL